MTAPPRGLEVDVLPSGRAVDLRLLRRLWTWVRPHQRQLWAGLALLLVGSGLTLLLPLVVKTAIDEHLTPGDLSGFRWLAGLYLAIAALDFLVRRWQTWLVDKVGQDALLDLRVALFRHLQGLSSRFYDRTPIGRLVGRVTTDIEALQEMFSSGVVTVLGDLVFLVATFCVLLWLNGELTLVTMSVVPVLLFVTLRIRLRVREAYVTMRAKLAHLNAYLHEHIVGMALVQTFRREGRTREGWRSINADLRDAQLRGVTLESVLSAVTELLANLTQALILWYGGGLIVGALAGGEVGAAPVLTLGTLFAFLDMMQRFFVPLTDLSLKYTVLQNATTAASRVFALLDRDERVPEPATPIDPGPPRGAVELDRVVFGYDPDEPVLRGVSVRLTPGERVAIVGATGSGKSTILKLLTRMYDVQEGAVRIDGVDVRDYALADLRRRIGVVPQDGFLFEGTVLENLRLGHPEVTEARAIAAAERMHLDEVVGRFPRGWREPVSERGKNLSAGEKQLVSFARVLAAEPAMLFLDEATSSVDTHTEELLQQAVHELVAGRTAIVVAHRLSTVRDVDRILVMHAGELVEQGTHEELLAGDGVYRRLHELQFAADPAPAAAPRLAGEPEREPVDPT